MPKHSVRRLVTAVLAIFLVAGFLLVDSSAQKRRRRRRAPSAPRITNPAIYQPSPTDSTNTSDTSATDTNAADAQPARPAGEQDPDAMKKTIRTLSTQWDKLNNKPTQREESQRSLFVLERLSRAETRSAALRAELRDVQAK